MKNSRGYKRAGETAGDNAMPNKRGKEGKSRNMQDIVHEAARSMGFI